MNNFYAKTLVILAIACAFNTLSSIQNDTKQSHFTTSSLLAQYVAGLQPSSEIDKASPANSLYWIATIDHLRYYIHTIIASHARAISKNGNTEQTATPAAKQAALTDLNNMLNQSGDLVFREILAAWQEVFHDARHNYHLGILCTDEDLQQEVMYLLRYFKTGVKEQQQALDKKAPSSALFETLNRHLLVNNSYSPFAQAFIHYHGFCDQQGLFADFQSFFHAITLHEVEHEMTCFSKEHLLSSPQKIASKVGTFRSAVHAVHKELYKSRQHDPETASHIKMADDLYLRYLKSIWIQFSI
jgi:hypothetical protein